MGTLPQSLTTGDLRDHAFGMAQHLGVKLQQVYVVPAGKGRWLRLLRRTVATPSRSRISFAAHVMGGVNYVLGHELAHLKLKAPGKNRCRRVASMFGAFFVVGMVAPSGWNRLSCATASSAIVTFFPLFWSADSSSPPMPGAVQLTGDPRSAISALFKHFEFKHDAAPLEQWSEKWLTHPSSLRPRASQIARKAGIPLEQIQEIAAASIAEMTTTFFRPPCSRCQNSLHAEEAQEACSRDFGNVEAMILVPLPFAWLPAIMRRIQFCMELSTWRARPRRLPPIGAGQICAALGPPRLIVALKGKLLKKESRPMPGAASPSVCSPPHHRVSTNQCQLGHRSLSSAQIASVTAAKK